MIKKSNDCAIIAGNGPSLKKIDYKRLPNSYDLFRCNQFYFEESYFLGKKIKAAFFNPGAMFYQYYTAKHLQEKEEYQIDYIVSSEYGNPILYTPNITEYFIEIINGYHEFLVKNKKIDSILRFNEFYNSIRTTSGVYMLLAAAVLGYKEIYITGIDFYQEDKYAFDIKKNNLLKVNPTFKNDNPNKNHEHSKEFDLKMMELIKNEYNLEIYTLSPNTILSELYPLAEETNNNFTLIEKEKNATLDIIFPKKKAIKKYEEFVLKKNLKPRRENLHQNIFYIIIRDLLDIPKHIKKYLKTKFNP